MTEWKQYKFSDFVEINPSVKIQKGIPVSFVEMKDLDNSMRYCESSQTKELSGGSRFVNGDTLFARITPCLENGKICQVRNLKNGYGFGSTEFHVFRGKDGVSDTDFVYYLSRWDEVRDFAEHNLEGSSGRQRVSKEAFDNLYLILPPLPTQRRIASILTSLDDNIDLLHRENATLEAMAETMFRQWFVVEAKEEWEEVRLEDIAILNAGGDKPKNVSPIRTKDLSVPIYSNGIDNEGLYGYTDTAKILVESVTISARGTIGFVVLRTEPFVPIVRLITIQPKDFVTSKFLYFWAKNQNINGTGTTQQQLTVPDFKQTKLLLPEKALIDKFTNIANQYYNKILLNKQQMQSLIQTRDVLLEKLMNNEIKI